MWLLSSCAATPTLPRNVRIDGQRFVLANGAPIVLAGPNVVVKGPPYMPMVEGSTICDDWPLDPSSTDPCIAAGTCRSCSTFNQADVDHIKALGWNTIRLGVVWAGAQPREENALDPAWLNRLHAVLNLTDANGLHVLLDNHGDMVGSAGCGNGAPMWFQRAAAPELIGKPLHTDLPYSVVAQLDIARLDGFSACADDEAKWARFAGDPNYNLLNECCQRLNFHNPPALGYTSISQRTMDHMLRPGAGRDQFVRYWRLLAEAVKSHPSAFGAELMNEPMSIRRRWMFDTWRACAEAINAVVPDMSVAVADLGENTLLPAWVTQLTGGGEFISAGTMAWMRSAGTLFYAWHYGDLPKAIDNMRAISKKWDMPSFGTELGCSQFDAAATANISHSYWHYSSFCNTGPVFGNRTVPTDTFGACILGWGSGSSSKCAKPTLGERGATVA